MRADATPAAARPTTTTHVPPLASDGATFSRCMRTLGEAAQAHAVANAKRADATANRCHPDRASASVMSASGPEGGSPPRGSAPKGRRDDEKGGKRKADQSRAATTPRTAAARTASRTPPRMSMFGKATQASAAAKAARTSAIIASPRPVKCPEGDDESWSASDMRMC